MVKRSEKSLIECLMVQKYYKKRSPILLLCHRRNRTEKASMNKLQFEFSFSVFNSLGQEAIVIICI